MDGSQSRKRKSNGRRSSILKVGGQSPTRNVLSDINPNNQVENEDVRSKKSRRSSRRVSFSATFQVKEFVNYPSWDSHPFERGLQSQNVVPSESEFSAGGPSDLHSLLTGAISTDARTEDSKVYDVPFSAESSHQEGANMTIRDAMAMDMTQAIGHISVLSDPRNQSSSTKSQMDIPAAFGDFPDVENDPNFKFDPVFKESDMESVSPLEFLRADTNHVNLEARNSKQRMPFACLSESTSSSRMMDQSAMEMTQALGHISAVHEGEAEGGGPDEEAGGEGLDHKVDAHSFLQQLMTKQNRDTTKTETDDKSARYMVETGDYWTPSENDIKEKNNPTRPNLTLMDSPSMEMTQALGRITTVNEFANESMGNGKNSGVADRPLSAQGSDVINENSQNKRVPFASVADYKPRESAFEHLNVTAADSPVAKMDTGSFLQRLSCTKKRNNTSTSPEEPEALNTDTGRHSPDVNSTRVDDEITFKKQVNSDKTVVDSQEMEMTEAIGHISHFDATSNKSIMNRRDKTNMTVLEPAGMEMTEAIGHISHFDATSNKSIMNRRDKMNMTVLEPAGMEMTEAIGHISHFHATSNKSVMNRREKTNMTVLEPAGMEMTEAIGHISSVYNIGDMSVMSGKSRPNKTVVEPTGMEMTEALGHISHYDATSNKSIMNRRDESNMTVLDPAGTALTEAIGHISHFDATSNKSIMNRREKTNMTVLEPAGMEMTEAIGHISHFDATSNKSIMNRREKTNMTVLEPAGMEMTEAIGHISHFDATSNKSIMNRREKTNMTVLEPAGMEMTEAIGHISSVYNIGDMPVMSCKNRPNKTVVEPTGMEMTEALGHISHYDEMRNKSLSYRRESSHKTVVEPVTMEMSRAVSNISAETNVDTHSVLNRRDSPDKTVVESTSIEITQAVGHVSAVDDTAHKSLTSGVEYPRPNMTIYEQAGMEMTEALGKISSLHDGNNKSLMDRKDRPNKTVMESAGMEMTEALGHISHIGGVTDRTLLNREEERPNMTVGDAIGMEMTEALGHISATNEDTRELLMNRQPWSNMTVIEPVGMEMTQALGNISTVSGVDSESLFKRKDKQNRTMMESTRMEMTEALGHISTVNGDRDKTQSSTHKGLISEQNSQIENRPASMVVDIGMTETQANRHSQVYELPVQTVTDSQRMVMTSAVGRISPVDEMKNKSLLHRKDKSNVTVTEPAAMEMTEPLRHTIDKSALSSKDRPHKTRMEATVMEEMSQAVGHISHCEGDRGEALSTVSPGSDGSNQSMLNPKDRAEKTLSEPVVVETTPALGHVSYVKENTTNWLDMDQTRTALLSLRAKINEHYSPVSKSKPAASQITSHKDTDEHIDRQFKAREVPLIISPANKSSSYGQRTNMAALESVAMETTQGLGHISPIGDSENKSLMDTKDRPTTTVMNSTQVEMLEALGLTSPVIKDRTVSPISRAERPGTAMVRSPPIETTGACGHVSTRNTNSSYLLDSEKIENQAASPRHQSVLQKSSPAHRSLAERSMNTESKGTSEVYKVSPSHTPDGLMTEDVPLVKAAGQNGVLNLNEQKPHLQHVLIEENRTTREAIMGDLLHPQDLSEEIPADLDFTKHVYADNNASTNKIAVPGEFEIPGSGLMKCLPSDSILSCINSTQSEAGNAQSSSKPPGLGVTSALTSEHLLSTSSMSRCDLEASHLSRSVMSAHMIEDVKAELSMSNLQPRKLTTVEEFLEYTDGLFLTYKARKSSLAPLSVAAPADVASRLEMMVTLPVELHAYEWLQQSMSSKMDEIQASTKEIQAKLIADPPSEFKDGNGMLVTQMESKIKEAKQNCRKESKCKFKKWRKKIVKSIYDGYKEEHEFLLQGNKEIEDEIAKIDDKLKSLDQDNSDLDQKLAELENLPNIDMDELEKLELQQKELEKTDAEYEKLLSEERELDKLKEELTIQIKAKEQKVREKEAAIQEYSSEPSRSQSVKDRCQQLDDLQRLVEWSVQHMDHQAAHFTFLYDSLSLNLVFDNSNNNEETPEDKQIRLRPVRDLSFQAHLSDEASCWAKLTHALFFSAVDERKILQNFSKNLPQLLCEVSCLVSWARRYSMDIENSAVLHHVKTNQTQVTVGFSSFKAFAKFDLVLDLQPSKYPHQSFQWFFRNHIGNISEDDMKHTLGRIIPGFSFYKDVIRAADGLLKR